jgi:hypothetical protein
MDSNIKLKAVDTRSLEQAIETIVSQATGWEYTCLIKHIEYKELGEAEITLSVRTSDWLKPTIAPEPSPE